MEENEEQYLPPSHPTPSQKGSSDLLKPAVINIETKKDKPSQFKRMQTKVKGKSPKNKRPPKLITVDTNPVIETKNGRLTLKQRAKKEVQRHSTQKLPDRSPSAATNTPSMSPSASKRLTFAKEVEEVKSPTFQRQATILKKRDAPARSSSEANKGRRATTRFNAKDLMSSITKKLGSSNEDAKRRSTIVTKRTNTLAEVQELSKADDTPTISLDKESTTTKDQWFKSTISPSSVINTNTSFDKFASRLKGMKQD